MRTSFKRVFCILLTFCILLIALMGFAACDSKVAVDGFEMPVGSRPQFKNRIAASDREIINSALADDSDVAAKKKAALKLYDIANTSRIKGGTSLMLQESYMGIRSSVSADTTLQSNAILATVRMHGFTLSSGDNWYNQFVGAVVGNSDNFMSLMTSMVKVSYHSESDPDAYWFNIIKKPEAGPNCDVDRFPYASFHLIQEATRYDLAGYMDKANILTAPNEIYNMDFCEEILADDVSIEHVNGVFKVHFAVDPNADSELLEKWFRMPKKDMAEGGQTLSSYLRYICDLEVWDNGYAKSYYADYVRSAGLGSGVTTDNFHYLWNEQEILDIISDDYRIDDLDIVSKNKLRDIDDYIDFYMSAGTVKGKMPTLYIVFIVIGCVIFAAIVAVIVVEILVRKGKLPKLAAKREARKQKRLAKKAAKRGIQLELNCEQAPSEFESGGTLVEIESDETLIETESGETPAEIESDEVPAAAENGEKSGETENDETPIAAESDETPIAVESGDETPLEDVMTETVRDDEAESVENVASETDKDDDEA